MENPPERADRALDLVALGAIAAIGVGLAWLAPTDLLGFDRAAAMTGVIGQLPITLPAAIFVLAAMAANVAAGAVVVAIARRQPFASLAEAALAGLAGAIALDAVLLFVLGGPGWFRAPVLIAVHVAILGGGWTRRRAVFNGAWSPPRPPTVAWALVLLVWAGAVVLQLAAPVVPFLDVLPNHVAPVEHLRTFGEFASLDTMPSPIYGPSRAFLGYTALLGVAAAMTGLPAALSVAASILPQAIFVALAVRRLGRALVGPGGELWAMVAFLLTASFGRLTDARANVLVLALIFWVLARFAEATRDSDGRSTTGESRLLGLGLGAAILVHPVIGAFGFATVGAVSVVLSRRAADVGIPALAMAAAMALPQVATTLGLALPAPAGLLAIPAVIVVDLAIRRISIVRRVLLSLGWAVLLVALPFSVIIADALGHAVLDGVTPVLATMPLLLLASVVGLALAARAVASPVVIAGVAVGVIVAAIAQLTPDTDLLGQTIHFELPKELDYWLPAIATFPAAIGLAALWREPTVPGAMRSVLVAVFLIAAALPLRATPINDLHRGEHRFSEALAIDLRHAGQGYWLNYPDSRRVVDAPRQALIDAVRGEIAAGRLGPSTQILHIASSFQQWVATPLGVFSGVIETVVAPDAVIEIHTIGGRLRPMADLPGLLARDEFPYLLYEPAGLDGPDLRPAIVGAGYISIFANGHGELFRANG